MEEVWLNYLLVAGAAVVAFIYRATKKQSIWYLLRGRHHMGRWHLRYVARHSVELGGAFFLIGRGLRNLIAFPTNQQPHPASAA